MLGGQLEHLSLATTQILNCGRLALLDVLHDGVERALCLPGEPLSLEVVRCLRLVAVSRLEYPVGNKPLDVVLELDLLRLEFVNYKVLGSPSWLSRHIQRLVVLDDPADSSLALRGSLVH